MEEKLFKHTVYTLGFLIIISFSFCLFLLSKNAELKKYKTKWDTFSSAVMSNRDKLPIATVPVFLYYFDDKMDNDGGDYSGWYIQYPKYKTINRIRTSVTVSTNLFGDDK